MKTDLFFIDSSLDTTLEDIQVFDFSDESYHITNREMEVLSLLTKGFSAKEIGIKLFLSPHTIISHKKSLIDKFSAKNTVQLVAIAVREGIV